MTWFLCLIYESGPKARLLRYAAGALHFAEKGVDPFLVSWNRIVLLHGTPGTGKTSLCKALAQMLSIRFNSRLVDVHVADIKAYAGPPTLQACYEILRSWYGNLIKLIKDGFPVAALASPDEKGDQVYAVAWAPNIGRAGNWSGMSWASPGSDGVVRLWQSNLKGITSYTGACFLVLPFAATFESCCFLDRRLQIPTLHILFKLSNVVYTIS
uniref:pachytene checkpoint protein 2 homolog n=1 Tax=Fragaria vesca subsp. vesca TaxID=101020 RepID=UPI0005CB4B9D|nr:PREDICTED: pachytene checkpoint protein 2 homolog [Fragaria vesca subsp. vesca]